MIQIGCVLVQVVCAVVSIRTKSLLIAALWLAAVSALTALPLYSLGAHEIAVIELSIGAGLVPVLCVFAISVMGRASSVLPSVVPRPLALTLVVIAGALLALLTLPVGGPQQPTPSDPQALTRILWDERGLDMLVQIGLIFSAAISILNVIATIRRPQTAQVAAVPNPVQQPDTVLVREQPEPMLEQERV